MSGFNNPKIASKAGKKSKAGKHEKTKQWEQLGADIVTTHAERFNKVLSDLEDEDFVKIYKDILNYFKPKISYNITRETDVTIESIEFVVDEEKENTK